VATVSIPKLLGLKRKPAKAPDPSEALLAAEKERNFFLHVHVPKCAGVTFNSILRRNFGRAFVEDYGLLNNFKYSAAQVLQMITGFPQLRCVASHRFSLNLPFDTEAAKLRAIVFVRNPVEWVASTYFYHRSQPNSLVTLAKEHDFERYVQERFVSAAPGSIGQVRFLTQVGDETGLDRIREAVAKCRVLLFPVERFEEACVLLEVLFPIYFRDCSFRRENASERDQAVASDIRKILSPVLDADFKLHQFALGHHEAAIQQAFPERSALEKRLADFRQRCQQRRK
jgi:hypothetical protein